MHDLPNIVAYMLRRWIEGGLYRTPGEAMDAVSWALARGDISAEEARMLLEVPLPPRINAPGGQA